MSIQWNRSCSSPARSNTSITSTGSTDTERDNLYNTMYSICNNAYTTIDITSSDETEIENEYKNLCENAARNKENIDIDCIYIKEPLLCTGNQKLDLDISCDQYPYINKSGVHRQCDTIKECNGTMADGSNCSTHDQWLNNQKTETNCPQGCVYSSSEDSECNYQTRIKNCCEQQTDLCLGNIDTTKDVICSDNSWLKPNAFSLPKKCVGDGTDSNECWHVGKPSLSNLPHDTVQNICCTYDSNIVLDTSAELSFNELLNNAQYYFNESKKERIKEDISSLTDLPSDDTNIAYPNGNPNCPCIFTWEDRADFENEEGTHLIASGWSLDGQSYLYPLNFAQTGCKADTLILPPACATQEGIIKDDAPEWCSKKACWVDPNNCEGIQNQPSSLFHRDGQPPSRYFSYETCNEKNYFSESIYNRQRCNEKHSRIGESCIHLNNAFKIIYKIKNEISDIPIDINHINNMVKKWKTESAIEEDTIMCKGNINKSEDYNCINEDKIDHPYAFIKPKGGGECCKIIGTCYNNTNRNEDVICPSTMNRKDDNTLGTTVAECCEKRVKCRGNNNIDQNFNCPHPLVPINNADNIFGDTREVCCIHPDERTINSVSDIEFETVSGTFDIEGDFLNVAGKDGSYERSNFEKHIKEDISTIINGFDKIYIEPKNIHIIEIIDGSITISFKILPHSSGISINKYFLEKVLSGKTKLPQINKEITEYGLYNIKSVPWYHSDNWPAWIWILIVIIVVSLGIRIVVS